jgi:enoyl-CoA hydratase/carnithine racemase
MAFETILTEVDGPTFVITMSRPAKRNAISIKMAQEVAEACKVAEAYSTVRGVLISGGDQFFSAGDDLNEARAITSFVDAFNHMKA